MVDPIEWPEDDFAPKAPAWVPGWPEAATRGEASPLNVGPFFCAPSTLKVTAARADTVRWWVRLRNWLRGVPTTYEMTYVMEYRPEGHDR